MLLYFAFTKLRFAELLTCVVFVRCLDLDALSCPSPFEELSDEDAIQIFVPPNLPPTTFALRDYVDKSETLTNLVNLGMFFLYVVHASLIDVSPYVTTTLFLGVNLSKLEERPNVGSMLVRLDFQEDVVPRLLFLKDLGVQDFQLGLMLTKNPFLLTESLENLQARSEVMMSVTP